MKAVLLCVIAFLTMGQGASARRLLDVAERSDHKLPPRLKALLAMARALYLHHETQLAHEEIAKQLDALRSHLYGGYARLFERLPVANPECSSPFATLTKAELQVLQALARGGSSRVVARETGRSSQTIDAHVKAIARKLGCRGRREAIALARARGLVG